MYLDVQVRKVTDLFEKSYKVITEQRDVYIYLSTRVPVSKTSYPLLVVRESSKNTHKE
jgi:hypothetical protein